MATIVPSFPGYSGAQLTLDIDQAEHQRRQKAGLGTATGHGFGGLDILMSLPHGLPVPLTDLTRPQQQYVRRAPAGICTITDHHVTRHAVRPCRVTMATVHAKSPSLTAMQSASRFAPFCARQVVVTRPPSLRSPERALEYSFYGIGLLLEHEDGGLETLVPPPPWRPSRHTPAAWWFAERAYHQFLDLTAAKPATDAA